VVQDAGVKAILVGESLVRENDPATAIKQLLEL
jgi:indole-3-glycerol phosphate synthase